MSTNVSAERWVGWSGRTSVLKSFGGLHRARCRLLRPRDESELATIFNRATVECRRVTLRSAGLSFDGQSLGEDLVVSTQAFGGIAVDAAMATVTVGGAASWGDIVRATLPQGLMPAVVVTSSETSAAGTLSADSYSRFSQTYGKEGRWINRLTLLTPRGDRLQLSRSEHPELFRAVIGGQGALGAVLNVTYRLVSIGKARCVETTLVKTRSYEELIGRTLAAPAREGEAVSSILVPGGELAFLFRSRYSEAEKLHRLPGMASSTPWRIPLEWAARLSWVSRFVWRTAYARLFQEGERYVDDLLEYTFFLDAHVRAKRLGMRLGFPMGLIQQTHLIPDQPSQAVVGFLRQTNEAMRSRHLSPVFYDVLRVPAEEDSLLSSSRNLPGFLVSVAFEESAPRVLARIRECLFDLSTQCADLGGRVHLSKNVHVRPEDLTRMYGSVLDEFFALKHRCDPVDILGSQFLKRLFPDRLAGCWA